MEDDLNVPIHTIDRLQGRSVASQLIAFQAYQVKEPRSFEWARELSCLSTDDDDYESSTVETTKLLHRVKVPISSGEYVAVSYKCNDVAGEYLVLDEKHKVSYSKVNDKIMSRVLNYMQHFHLPTVWIDKESINQNDPRDVQDAVQAMDLVYRCSNHALGFLSIRIEKQGQLDLLCELKSGRLCKGQRPVLRSHVDFQMARGVLRILNYLTSDSWWARRWTFQEEYCSNLKLLIPHDRRLLKQNWDPDSQKMPDEVILSASKLRKQATLFCLACSRAGLFNTNIEVAKMCKTVMERAKSYTVLHNYKQHDEHGLVCRPMSSQILADISKRKITMSVDTIAILANCCGYSIQLDRHKLVSAPQSSLSLAILALCLLNGEILWSKHKASLNQNMVRFLQTQAFDRFDPPSDSQELTFMKKCRLVNVRFTEEGIKTTGHIWRIRKRLRGNSIRIRVPQYSRDDEKPTFACLHRFVSILTQQGYQFLAHKLKSYLEGTIPSHVRGHQILTEIFHDSAAYLANSIQAGADLIVAQHAINGSRWAIFVCNWHRTTQARPSFVFTASEGAEFDDVVGKFRSPDKYVALTVFSDGLTQNGQRLIRARGWINGLTFPGEAREQDVVFKWPSVLTEIVGRDESTSSSGSDSGSEDTDEAELESGSEESTQSTTS